MPPLRPLGPPAPTSGRARPVHRWSATFVDPDEESAYLVHQFERNWRSLAVAAVVVALPWLAFIPVDLVVAPTATAAGVSVTARLVGAATLALAARALWRPATTTAASSGRLFDAAAIITASCFLVITAARPTRIGTLEVSAVLFGTALVLFTPIPLWRRGAIAAGFYASFVLVLERAAAPGSVDAGLLGANLAMALACGLACGAHLDRTARSSYLLLRRSEQLNDQLAAEVRSSEVLRATLARRASEDSLTGLLNRGAFFEAAEALTAELDAVAAPSATMMIDADRFKAVNDTYGHAMGDVVLRQLAEDLRRELRDGDLIGRLGGEEFCVFLPATEMADAMGVADRFRAAVGSRSAVVGSQRIPVTVSVGVAERRPHEPLDVSLQRADRAMYEAKRAGGDRLNCDVDVCPSIPGRPDLAEACASSRRCSRHS